MLYLLNVIQITCDTQVLTYSRYYRGTMSGHPAPAPPVSRVLPLVPELSLFVPSLAPDQVKGVLSVKILLLVL